jgi:hypothetical protein
LLVSALRDHTILLLCRLLKHSMLGWRGMKHRDRIVDDEDHLILTSLQIALASAKHLRRRMLAYLIEMAITQLMDERKTLARERRTRAGHNHK